MRVLLAGGGSGGSSAPVLAVAQELRKRTECEFLYIGTSSGPELELVSRMGIPFRSVQTGKLRRTGPGRILWTCSGSLWG